MTEQLIPLLGKSLESDEIKALFAEWGVAYPKKTTCTPNNSSMGSCKMDKDGISLHFHFGANSRFLKPIPAKRKGSFVGLLREFRYTQKYKGEIPLGLKLAMTPDEMTAFFGKPHESDMFGMKNTIWRKSYLDRYELIVNDYVIDGKYTREICISMLWDANLDTLEDYEKAGL